MNRPLQNSAQQQPPPPESHRSAPTADSRHSQPATGRRSEESHFDVAEATNHPLLHRGGATPILLRSIRKKFCTKIHRPTAWRSQLSALESWLILLEKRSVSSAAAMTAIRETNFPGIAPAARGKVRDIYDLGDKLLIVATDRLSAFDVVMPTPIPDKGKVLTQLSLFWFNLLQNVIANHILSAADFPAPFDTYHEQLAGRAMLVRKTQPLPIECVVRGYLSGSGWKEYQATGKVCGIALPSGLRESDKLPEPIFTPATKATSGHDENISFERAAELIGKPLAEKVRAVSIEIYNRASAYAAPRGVLLADTKFEFGLLPGREAAEELIWIDEALTPDSSRFWPASQYRPGGAQASFDKQFVRDYLERIQWRKTPPGPELPPDVVAATRAKYREAYRILVGHELN
jgi:phosphoribosylaminoimidazole-succinocarboxamide synthase